MKIPQPLFEGRLVRRYKRFLTDVELVDGSLVTAHTPNTGSMMECAIPGYRVLLSRSNNPNRKLPYTLERIEVNGYWVDTHTHRAVIFFLVQRGECLSFHPADTIDPEYGRLLRQAVQGGVEALAYKTRVTPTETIINKKIPVVLHED